MTDNRDDDKRGGKGRAPGGPRKPFGGRDGERPRSFKPRGDRPFGDRPPRDGDRPFKPRGDRPFGDRPPRDGDRPFKPRGDRPFGDRPPRDGDRPFKPRGDRPFGDRPPREGGDRPFKPRGDRPFGDRPPREGGDRPFKPRGDRPFGDRPPREGGDRPFKPKGDRPFGDRPPREGGDRPFKPRGDRPPRDGDRKPFRPREDRGDGERGFRPRRFEDRAPKAEADEGERIAKVMARAGLCSRRDAEEWIAAGRVSVNGTVIDSPALDIGPEDKVLVDGAPLPAKERTRLWLYHKPKGLVTTEHDPEGRPTVFDNLPEGLPRVMSVGRLDINTEGLLLLTNDGGLARVLAHPKTAWLRRYRVRVHGEVDQAQLDTLREGITIDDPEDGPVEYAPIVAKLERTKGTNSWMTMDLREGKNREIKKVLEHFGLSVTRLIRVSFGPFQLGDMPEGTAEEIRGRYLRDQLGERLAEEAGCDFEAPVFQHDAAAEAPRSRVAPQDREGRARYASSEEDLPKRRYDPKKPGEKRSLALAGERPDLKVEREKVADRKGRTVKVERVVSLDAVKPSPEEARDPNRSFRRREDDDRPFGDRPPREGGDRPFKPRGDRPFGDRPPRDGGDRPFKPRGDRPFGDRPPREGGDRPFKPRGDRPFGDRPPREGGDRPFKPRGDRPFGDRPPREGGDRPFKPRGDRPFGDRPLREGGDRPFKPRGDRPFGDRPPREGGDRPFKPRGDRPFGDRPPREGGDRPFKPRGDRPFGDRPPREGGDRPFKPRGDRPFGDRPPREGGDRPFKPRGDRPFGDRPPREGGDRPFKPRGGKPGGFKPGPRRPGGPGADRRR